MTGDEPWRARNDEVARAIVGQRLDPLRVASCECGKQVATVYRWRDGRRYAWVPSHPMRLTGTGRFVRTPPLVIGLDDGPWEPQLRVCRCGRGFLLSARTTNATDYPEGAIYARFSPGDRDTAAAAGDAVVGWRLAGVAVERIADGLHLVRLGKGTTATLTP